MQSPTRQIPWSDIVVARIANERPRMARELGGCDIRAPFGMLNLTQDEENRVVEQIYRDYDSLRRGIWPIWILALHRTHQQPHTSAQVTLVAPPFYITGQHVV